MRGGGKKQPLILQVSQHLLEDMGGGGEAAKRSTYFHSDKNKSFFVSKLYVYRDGGHEQLISKDGRLKPSFAERDKKDIDRSARNLNKLV